MYLTFVRGVGLCLKLFLSTRKESLVMSGYVRMGGGGWLASWRTCAAASAASGAAAAAGAEGGPASCDAFGSPAPGTSGCGAGVVRLGGPTGWGGGASWSRGCRGGGFFH